MNINIIAEINFNITEKGKEILNKLNKTIEDARKEFEYQIEQLILEEVDDPELKELMEIKVSVSSEIK